MDGDEMDQLLVGAIIAADDSGFEALVAAGPAGVEAFRSWLAGERKVQIPRGRDRELIDNTAALSARLAEQFPEAFLAAFNSPRWVNESFVLIGLGYTGRPEAKPLLIQALGSRASSDVRLNAAIALAHLPGADATGALIEALDDKEYLVQYHSIRSLGQIGDRAALDRLLTLAADPPNRGIAIVTSEAVARLADRLGLTIQLPEPDMSRWAPLRVRLATEEDD
jgi:hypothetical protein